MRAYKGFNIGLKCRGYQFVIGKNVCDEANCVKNGFHCAENPIDCLSYYPNVRTSEYWIVDAGGDIDEDAIDSKISCTELTLLKRLSIKEFLLHCLVFLSKHPDYKTHSYVSNECCRAERGFGIVCGLNPIAKGKYGDVLAILQFNRQGKAIASGIYVVGTPGIESDKYYNVMGQEVEYE